MTINAQNLTLHKPEPYELKVSGALDTMQVDGTLSLHITIEKSGDGKPTSILVGLMDQAALHGLLRRLYSLGLPLVSVNCIRSHKKE